MTDLEKELNGLKEDKEKINKILNQNKEQYADLIKSYLGETIKNELKPKTKITFKEKLRRKLNDILS